MPAPARSSTFSPPVHRGLLKTQRNHDPDFFLLDVPLTERDRGGDGRADCAHKHRRHGVNVQVVTEPGG